MTDSPIKQAVDQALVYRRRKPARIGPPKVPKKFLISSLPPQHQGNSRTRRVFPEINVRALASAVGVSEGLVGRIMIGERPISLAFCMKCVECFNGGVGEDNERKGGWNLDVFVKWWVAEVRRMGKHSVKVTGVVGGNIFGDGTSGKNG